MSINLSGLFRTSRIRKREQYVEGEKSKTGNLRAGNSGILSSENGEVAGSCVRKAHLRALGIEIDPPTEDKLIMFDLGFASEDIIAEKLVRAMPEGHILLREEEIPIEWRTTNGTKITGRPDMVICSVDAIVPAGSDIGPVSNGIGEVVEYTGPISRTPRPILGIELKSTHSLWVAREVVFNRKPKLGNLIQAAHYMWQLNVPYKLVYTNYSQLGQGMAGNEWIVKQFPRPGEPGSEYIEYNDKKKTIKHIRQFEIVYDLRFDEHGRLQFKREDEADTLWTSTIVTRDDIRNFYEYTATMASDKKLGPRPSQVDSLGNKAGYKDCDYCPLKPVCDEHEDDGYDKWISEVNKLKFQGTPTE